MFEAIRSNSGIIALVAIAGLVATAVLFIRRTWLGRIFADEFGVSDVQSNYTRTYAWMANQLGHMTLGLGAALAWVWAVEALATAIAQAIGADSSGSTAGWVALVLGGLVAGGVVWKLGGLFRPKGGDEHVPVLRPQQCLAVSVTLLSVALGTLMTGFPQTAAGFLSFISFGFLYWVRDEILFWNALDGPESTVRATRFVLDMTHGFGAGLVSLGIWGAKEFGSDQQGTHAAIRRARFRRGLPPEAYGRAETELARESLWDSFCDGLFYLTGALVAVGIVASAPDFDNFPAESAWELFALLFFGAIMLVVGRTYVYRQRALDWSGVPYSWRLGLIDTPLRGVCDLGQAPDPDPLAAAPILHLEELLDLTQADCEPFQMVIWGERGAGKTPLASAIASEAAVDHIGAIPRFCWDSDPTRVIVRYATFAEADLDEEDDRVAVEHKMRMAARPAPPPDRKPDREPLLVAGRLLWPLTKADMVIVDNIPSGAFRVTATADPAPKLERLLDELARKNGLRRVVWVLEGVPRRDGQGEPERNPDGGIVYDDDATRALATAFGRALRNRCSLPVPCIEVRKPAA